MAAPCRGCDFDSNPQGLGALILYTVSHLSPTLGALLDLKDRKCQEAKLLVLQPRPANQPPAALGPTQRGGMKISLLKVWAPCALSSVMNWKVWQSFPSPLTFGGDNQTQPEFSRGWSSPFWLTWVLARFQSVCPRVFPPRSSPLRVINVVDQHGVLWGVGEMKASSHEIRIPRQRADIALRTTVGWHGHLCQGSEEKSTQHINSQVSGVPARKPHLEQRL